MAHAVNLMRVCNSFHRASAYGTEGMRFLCLLHDCLEPKDMQGLVEYLRVSTRRTSFPRIEGVRQQMTAGHRPRALIPAGAAVGESGFNRTEHGRSVPPPL